MQTVTVTTQATSQPQGQATPPLQQHHGTAMADVRLVLLAGGHVRQDFVSLMDVSSPAMLPYMGRPLIYITVLHFLKLGGREVILVIPKSEKRVEAFLRASFGTRMTFTIVRAPDKSGATPLQSLEAALDVLNLDASSECPALISHGDIYYDVGQFQAGDRPVVFTSAHVDSDKYSSI